MLLLINDKTGLMSMMISMTTDELDEWSMIFLMTQNDDDIDDWNARKRAMIATDQVES